MSRQDAQRCVNFQMHQPWDRDTAPAAMPTGGALDMLKALRAWEKRKGLAHDYRGVIRHSARMDAAERLERANNAIPDSAP